MGRLMTRIGRYLQIEQADKFAYMAQNIITKQVSLAIGAGQ
jgi:hypothetical protein